MNRIIGGSALLSVLRCAALTALLTGFVHAEGTETLGPAQLTLASGSGSVAAGVGLQESQPGTINIDVPGDVVQAILYWSGAVATNAPSDDTVSINGNIVTGTMVGGPAFFFGFSGNDFHYSGYRADITSLGLVASGSNTLTIDGLENIIDGFGENSGAAVVVIYDDGTAGEVLVRDGMDTAFFGFADPRKSTEPQTFGVEAAGEARTADLTVFVGSVGSADRDSIVRVTAGGVTTDHVNVLSSGDGPLWDTLTLPVDVPAGATDVTVELISGDDSGNSGPEAASLTWVGTTLSIGAGTPPGDTTPPVIVCEIVNHCWWFKEAVFDATDDSGDPVDVTAVFELSCGEIEIESGQIFVGLCSWYCCAWLWCDVLVMQTPSLKLTVTATDSSGNTAVCCETLYDYTD
ncbi:MAG: hypothetical protein AAF488_15070 [Planctomycetota bacterium]